MKLKLFLPDCGWDSSPPCSCRPQHCPAPLPSSCHQWPQSCKYRKGGGSKSMCLCSCNCLCLCVCVPVVRAVSVWHRSVGLVGDQPVEALVCEESDLLPVGARHIVTACVEVAQQQDVLQGECDGSTTHLYFIFHQIHYPLHSTF